MSWCIGIDFGLKHWGLARGIDGIVEPIVSLPAIKGIPCWSDVHHAVKPWFRGKWVMGVALGRDGELLSPARVLKAQWSIIEEALGGEVILVDETLTTQEAREYLARHRQAFHKSAIDAISACYILKHYYESDASAWKWEESSHR